MALKLINAPTEQPVSLDEARTQCRVDGTDSDVLLGVLIKAARQLAESKTNRGFAPAEWELSLDAFPSAIVLPVSPVTAIASVKYLDTAGVEQTLPGTAYVADLNSIPARIAPAANASWPATADRTGAVRIRFNAGHAVNDDYIAAAKLWMLMAISTWFSNPEAVVTANIAGLPRTYCDGLLDEYRIYQ